MKKTKRTAFMHYFVHCRTFEHDEVVDFPNSNCNIGGQSLMTSSTSLTYKKTRTTSNTAFHNLVDVI
uniref:Uncharacterized protein n=1 Tax=Oryza meridionalis TaxID=40149 RepID=A0A0E0EJI0_9ORYZ